MLSRRINVAMLALILCSGIMSAQNSFKDYIPPEYSYNIRKADSLESGKFLTINIDGKKQRLIFDTGAPKSVLFSKSDNQKKIFSSGEIKSATGEKVAINVIRTNIFSSSIVETRYKTMYSIPDESEKFSCSTYKMDGILGMDFYYGAKKPILLDYESNTVKILEDFNKNAYTGYYEVDVKFKGLLFKHIFIEILVNGKKEKFLFDTGATDATLYMRTPNKSIKSDFVFESMVFTASGVKNSIMNAVIENNISLESLSGLKSDIIYLNELPNNLMGLSFIKNFNWIIDRKKGKMYFKPISGRQFSSEIMARKSILVTSYQNKLKVVFLNKLKNKTKFKIGDEIISVNNQNITPQNICEMQNLLNSTEDWEMLNVKIK